MFQDGRNCTIKCNIINLRPEDWNCKLQTGNWIPINQKSTHKNQNPSKKIVKKNSSIQSKLLTYKLPHRSSGGHRLFNPLQIDVAATQEENQIQKDFGDLLQAIYCNSLFPRQFHALLSLPLLGAFHLSLTVLVRYRSLANILL